MAKVICIMGESGSGKTTSMRTLDPKTTFYIDCDMKGLSWKDWRTQYSRENHNYLRTDDIPTVYSALKELQAKQKQFKTVVIDTINGLMIADEMNRMKEKGYDKWVDLAQCVWRLICDCHKLRDDLTVIFTAHTQTEHDENGYMFTRIKTSGRKLDKIVLETKFTTVLLAKCTGEEYVFEVHANNSTTKTPLGAFGEDVKEVPNDAAAVLKALEDF